MKTTPGSDQESMDIAVAPAPGGAPAARTVFATAPVNTDRARTMFPDISALETNTLSTPRRQRPSPALDPVSRSNVSRIAKWGMLMSLLTLVAYLPAYFYDKTMTVQARTGDPDHAPYFLAAITAAATLAAVIATGLPRLLLPRFFGRWREAVEAMRDWTIVGICTGLLYYGGVMLAREITSGPMARVTTLTEWLMFRLPILAMAGMISVFIARTVAIRGDGLVAKGVGAAILQLVIQVALLGALEKPIEAVVHYYVGIAGITTILGGISLLLAILSVATVTWAVNADATLSGSRRRRASGGIEDGTGPVDLTLTVIGGRESGKTVLMAGAFFEWSTQNLGELRITPAHSAEDGHDGLANLEDVARELFVDNHFPVGTVSTQNLPFDLALGNEKIARFSFLDYPGGAIAGRVADGKVVDEFWHRVDDTDGVVMIADMSYCRRGQRDSDFLEVRNAYRSVMQRLVDRNGKRRVVPVALVLTKCDEFISPETGHIDTAALKAALHEFQYDELEAEWRQMNSKSGPGFAEFTTWMTSAITYSEPQRGADGRPDMSKPFRIAPPPPAILPTGCASPLLWMTSKVMRWNVTLFYDISTFFFGSSGRVRRRVDSILELERIAEERAGQA